MMRQRFATKGLLLLALTMFGLPARPAAALGQPQPQDQSKQPYTIPEYNAFQAARAETDPQARIKLLDDFVVKFPNSSLLQYVYNLYYTTYNDLKNYPKVIEYVDKLLAMGDKVDAGTHLAAIQVRAQVFPAAFNPKAPDAPAQLTKERDAALLGVKLLKAFPKPDKSNLTDAQFADQKKPVIVFFLGSAGFAQLQLKDYAGAIASFKESLSLNPSDAVTSYRLGICYLEMKPPQPLDGFWQLARAINLKIPDDAKVKDYLRRQILSYEQPGCDSLADAQLNELLQLAAGSPDRPATYTIPSQADLDKVRQSSNILTVLADLKAGGDKAKITWLAICGAEFPEVVGKVIEVKPASDSIELLLYTGATPEEIEAATTPNLDVKLAGQPDASRLQKGDGVRFSGTLASYDPEPAFMIHWEKAKVNPEDIPAEKGGAKHPPHKVPPKPGKQGS